MHAYEKPRRGSRVFFNYLCCDKAEQLEIQNQNNQNRRKERGYQTMTNLIKKFENEGKTKIL